LKSITHCSIPLRNTRVAGCSDAGNFLNYLHSPQPISRPVRFTLTIACAFFCTLFASVQMENAAFTETGRGASFAFLSDYQALGINPANLGIGNRYNKKYTLGILRAGASL
jgi:hypothetical protein